MSGLRTALFASLLSGTPMDWSPGTASAPMMGPETVQVDDLAATLEDDVTSLAWGLEVRASQLRGIDSPSQVELALAAESLELLVPLADHVGLTAQRAALEDVSFRLLEPEAYDAVATVVPSTPEFDARLLESLKADARDLLTAQGIEGIVTGRSKSLYGVHRKTSRKGVSVDDIVDRLGLRIRVETVDECYAVLDALRAQFEEVDGTFDDYVASPKANGYQSIQLALRAGEDRDSSEPVEFQIRTHDMHEEAEHGAAAHWRYKQS